MRHFRLTRFHLVVAMLIASLAFTGVGYAASLGLGSNQLHVWNQTLTKGTCSPNAGDDTYVQQLFPTSTSGGTASTLTISPVAAAQDYAFIRFDLTGCSLPTTAGADSATLTVNVTTTGADTISLFPVYSSWSSSTLNWNGIGGLTIGSTATTSFSSSSSGNKTLTVTSDVDAAIKAGALWGWELRATSGTAIVAVGALDGPASRRPSISISYEK
jgi:hypothetical protein